MHREVIRRSRSEVAVLHRRAVADGPGGAPPGGLTALAAGMTGAEGRADAAATATSRGAEVAVLTSVAITADTGRTVTTRIWLAIRAPGRAANLVSKWVGRVHKDTARRAAGAALSAVASFPVLLVTAAAAEGLGLAGATVWRRCLSGRVRPSKAVVCCMLPSVRER